MRNRKTDFLKVVAIVLFLTGCGSAQTYLTGQLERATVERDTFTATETEQSETEETEDAHTQAEEEEPSVCFVHVSGAVQDPGVYELPAGSRLYEAVDLAGGLMEDAAEAYCNLAAPIEDGTQYHIPTKEEAETLEAPSGKTTQAGSYTADGKLDLNRATKEELTELPGIGESKAETILTYREEHGGFGSTEELKQVSGIGDATFEKLRDDITVK